jgi:hypothetical protein
MVVTLTRTVTHRSADWREDLRFDTPVLRSLLELLAAVQVLAPVSFKPRLST